MPPAALSLAFFIIEEGIKLEPGIAAACKALFAKADPTPDDWAALRAKITAKSYDDYIAAAAPPTFAPLPTELAPAAAPTTTALPSVAPAGSALIVAPVAVFTGLPTDPHA